MNKQRLLHSLAKTAGPCRAVAFDVFDTLLYRCAARPADVFALMERTGAAAPGFAAARTAAEAAARPPHGEVTLAQIYADPALRGADPAAECAAELACVSADPDLLAAARACKARGLAVYAVSDMYLPARQVEAMLRRCGFDFLDGVFVSCEYGVQKRSGRLFRLFLQKTGLGARQVLFVGNDRRADALGAALAGIRCLLVPPPAAPAYYVPPQTPEQGALWAFVRPRAPAGSPAWQVGYSLLGPLLTGFAAWLRRQQAQQPGARLVFLARDMDLVRRLYGAPAGQGTGYLRVSRRSLCPALLQRPLGAAALELLADALPRQRLTAAQALEYLGFAPGTALPGVPPAAAVDLRSRPLPAAAQDFLRAVAALGKGPAGEPVRRQAQLVRRYLAEQGIGRGPVLLVDIGSGGTTQRLLEELTGAELCGLYLACDARLHAHLPPERARAFLFGGRPAPLWYWAGQPMLERLISEPCGPTAGYAPGPGGVQPLCAPAAPAPAVEAARAGALEFAERWRAGAWGAMPPPADYAAEALGAMIRAPRPAEAAALGDLTVEDGGVWPLAAPRPAAYRRDPRAFGRDLARARWKTAFLRRAVPLPLPWWRLYAALKAKNKL